MNWVGLYTLIRKENGRTFRVATQALVTPWISALLYIFIFGKVVGSRIQSISGVNYIDFVLPGILMMNVIMSAFSHSSASIYMQRFVKNIEELLVSPLSYLEMIIGFMVSGVLRALLVGVGIFIIAIFFGAANVAHLPLFIFYTLAVSIIFSLLGMLVGLWANGFEQLNILTTFVIMPLNFLGGVFYSINMLPGSLKILATWNPMFYFIDGIRYSMIGVRESSAGVGYIMIFSSILVIGYTVWYLFKIGWRIKA